MLNKPLLHLRYVKGVLSEETVKEAETPRARSFDRDAFRKRLDWVYPHLAAVGLPAKLSVSELKGIRESEEDAAPLLEKKAKAAVPLFAE